MRSKIEDLDATTWELQGQNLFLQEQVKKEESVKLVRTLNTLMPTS